MESSTAPSSGEGHEMPDWLRLVDIEDFSKHFQFVPDRYMFLVYAVSKLLRVHFALKDL
jgi:hypothetical protein